MAGRSDDGRNRKNLQSIRSILTRLEEMGDASHKIATSELDQTETAAESKALGRGQGTSVVTPISLRRKLASAGDSTPRLEIPGALRTAPGNVGTATTSQTPEFHKGIEQSASGNIDATKEMWRLSPYELDPANPHAAARPERPQPALNGSPGTRQIKRAVLAVTVALIAVACGLTLKVFLLSPAVSTQASNHPAVKQTPSGIVTATGFPSSLDKTATAALDVPAPVPARRPTSVHAISPEPAGVDFEWPIEATSGVAVPVPLRVSQTLVAGVDEYYITINGLPLGSLLNKGRMVYPGVWAIESNETFNLQLTMSGRGPTTTTVSLILVARPGRILAESRGIIVLRDN